LAAPLLRKKTGVLGNLCQMAARKFNWLENVFKDASAKALVMFMSPLTFLLVEFWPTFLLTFYFKTSMAINK